MKRFVPDKDIPFSEHPSKNAEPRKRWDLDDDAAGLVFGQQQDRAATEEERQRVTDDLNERDREV